QRSGFDHRDLCARRCRRKNENDRQFSHRVRIHSDFVAHLRIVLVEPQEAGNVGATARVMKNFGFHELWIVGKHTPLDPLAGWWASGADDVVANARFAPTLHYALADAKVTVATTSARGRTTPVDFSPSQA